MSKTLNIKSLYTADKLTARIEAFGKSGLRMQDEAHKLACSVLHHLGTHKDTRYVLMFLQNVPDMVRSNGLRAWFEAFGPVKFTVGEGDAIEQALFCKDKQTKLGEAIAKPFWKFSAMEGKPYIPMDVAAEMEKLIKRLLADAKKTGKDHSGIVNVLKGYAPATTEMVHADTDPLAEVHANA
jgi:hypothetical protein